MPSSHCQYEKVPNACTDDDGWRKGLGEHIERPPEKALVTASDKWKGKDVSEEYGQQQGKAHEEFQPKPELGPTARLDRLPSVLVSRHFYYSSAKQFALASIASMLLNSPLLKRLGVGLKE
ncbi:hypothetical protein [Roseimicrobium gellanilyticum]|uniref:hypothetical protein n=1 Tax=Roseimicrobium gellanilyticum TaxID=748857 RepID=UPI0011BF8781|nr:hypothetical protein [Roseimicrobium gellanilyticum]